MPMDMMLGTMVLHLGSFGLYFLIYHRKRMTPALIYQATVHIMVFAGHLVSVFLYEVMFGPTGVLELLDYSNYLIEVLLLRFVILWVMVHVYQMMVRHMSSMEERRIYVFIGLNQALYTYIFLYVVSHTTVVYQALSVVGFITTCLMVVNFIIYSVYVQKRQVTMLFEKYGSYTLSLGPVLYKIRERENKLFTMTEALGRELPMEREELEERIDEIKRDGFIKISFTDDALMNALLFKYYMILQNYNMDLETLIPKDFQKIYQQFGELYNVMDLFFEICLHVIENETVYERRMGRERVNIRVSAIRRGYKFTGVVQGRIKNLVEVNRLVEEIMEVQIGDTGFIKRVRMEIGPTELKMRVQ